MLLFTEVGYPSFDSSICLQLVLEVPLREGATCVFLGLDTGVDGGRSETVNLGMTDQGKPQH